jgi:GxxExxY protein
MNAGGEDDELGDDIKDVACDRATLNKITEGIIGCAIEVSNVLGCGFLEKVYENALAHEIKRHGLKVEQQSAVSVYYDDAIVGEYMADLLVEKRVLVELKAVQKLDAVHKAQCLNYLNATGLPLCLLLNFGRPRLEIKRLVMTSYRTHPCSSVVPLSGLRNGVTADERG